MSTTGQSATLYLLLQFQKFLHGHHLLLRLPERAVDTARGAAAQPLVELQLREFYLHKRHGSWASPALYSTASLLHVGGVVDKQPRPPVWRELFARACFATSGGKTHSCSRQQQRTSQRGKNGYSCAFKRSRSKADSERNSEEPPMSDMVRNSRTQPPHVMHCRYLSLFFSLEVLSDPHNTLCGHSYCK